MMGERMVMQEALFYSFSLEQHVPADHLLRSVGRSVDLSGIWEHLRPYYSEAGRPWVDPELLMPAPTCSEERSLRRAAPPAEGQVVAHGRDLFSSSCS
jgi:hypothetical protein